MCGGNLSVLKKRWEQQQQPSTQTAQPQAKPIRTAVHQTHIGQSTGHKSRPTSQIETLQSPVLLQDRDTEPETPVHPETSHFNHLQSAGLKDLTDMEAKPSRSADEQGGAAAEVPDSEKPSVPLNSLKMMFEKGENMSDHVSLHLSHF